MPQELYSPQGKKTGEFIHVYPERYEKEHQLGTTGCWCNPKQELENGTWIMIHNVCEA